MDVADLHGKVALVTGASRGIGASVARILAGRGADVVVNYRSKAARAEEVAAAVQAIGQRSLLAQADMTEAAEMRAMMRLVETHFGHLDLVILNASGGLERDRPREYAMELNLVAQVRAVDLALPLMPAGGRIVFVTSHLAHFYGEKTGYAAYEPVAASKKAGEQALRARVDDLMQRGVSLIVVSGDLIEGTITPRLMDRLQPGIIESRRVEAGSLPTVEEFARAIVDAAANPLLQTGATVFVGSTDWTTG